MRHPVPAIMTRPTRIVGTISYLPLRPLAPIYFATDCGALAPFFRLLHCVRSCAPSGGGLPAAGRLSGAPPRASPGVVIPSRARDPSSHLCPRAALHLVFSFVERGSVLPLFLLSGYYQPVISRASFARGNPLFLSGCPRAALARGFSFLDCGALARLCRLRLLPSPRVSRLSPHLC